MIRSQNLVYSYDRSQSFHFPDLEATAEKPLLILGQSGKGKTTMLHLLAGLLEPASGEIYIHGKDITTLSKAKMDRFRGENIGLIFQKSHFISSMHVRDNLRLAQYLAGKKADDQTIDDVLNRLNISHKHNSKTSRLSIGEQQRVAIARAVINRPEVILADEPTSSLDDEHTEEVISLLEEQAKVAGAALVIVTHDARLKDHFSHRIVLK